MNHIPGYIIYPNIREIVAAMDETLSLNRWRIITGLRCTGKTRLLEEYIKREKLGLRPHEIIKISIDEPQSNSARGRRFSTPASFLAFWELDQALRALVPRRYRKYQRIAPPENTSVYDNMFPRLYHNVRTHAGKMKIRLFLIDNAQYADARTLKRFKALYEYLHKECAFILCAQRAPDEEATRVLASEFWGDTLAAVRETLLPPRELKKVTSKVFREELIIQLLKPKNLGADFDVGTETNPTIVKDLWMQVKGNWARIDYMAQLFAVGLRQFSKRNEQGVWIITQEVVDWVLSRLRGQVTREQADSDAQDESEDEEGATREGE